MDEESPGSAEQDTGQRPAEVTPGTVQQKINASFYGVSVEMCGKSAQGRW